MLFFAFFLKRASIGVVPRDGTRQVYFLSPLERGRKELIMLNTLKTLETSKNDNRITVSGLGEDAGLSFLVNDTTAQKVLDLLQSVAIPQTFEWGSKTVRKAAQKIESTDGVFEYRPVDTDFGTMYQVRIVPRNSKESLESQYASNMTQKIKGLPGIVEFVYTAKNKKSYQGRGFKTEAEAKKAVETLSAE